MIFLSCPRVLNRSLILLPALGQDAPLDIVHAFFNDLIATLKTFDPLMDRVGLLEKYVVTHVDIIDIDKAAG